jgi:cytochrome c551/c552
MRRFKQTTLLVAIAAIGLMWVGSSRAGVSDGHTSRGCSSCHVPHNATGDGGANVNLLVPLWNPGHSTTTLTDNYVGSPNTMDATVGAVNGASKLCVSCHDGTYDHVTPEHAFGPLGVAGGEYVGMGGLLNSHPVSFVYDDALALADGELVDPDTLAADVRDGYDQMQCTSCHNIHADAVEDVEDNPATERDETKDYPKLRWAYDAEFCRTCHIK